MSLADITGTPLDQTTFHTIADLAYRESGLTLVAEKAPMVQSRLRHRLHDLGLTDFEEYAAFLTSSDGTNERRRLISALTTNVSHFFREDHHFDRMITLVRQRLPDLRAGKPVRIWSAGCSQGQEPLSIAIALSEAMPEITSHDLRILATDIDPKVIAFAKAATYEKRMTKRVSPALMDRYFVPLDPPGQVQHFEATPEILSLVRYREHNLLGQWPMKMPFDIVYCRNTVIYFDVKTQSALWPRFRQILKPDGFLFLGHSERINAPAEFGFQCVGPTTYQPINC